MKKLFFTTTLAGLMLLAPPVSAKFSRPKCKTASLRMWQNNQKSCLRSMRSGIESKKTSVTKAVAVCDCIADQMVNNLTCDEMKKLSEKKFFEDYTKKVSQFCGARAGFKAWPASKKSK